MLCGFEPLRLDSHERSISSSQHWEEAARAIKTGRQAHVGTFIFVSNAIAALGSSERKSPKPAAFNVGIKQTSYTLRVVRSGSTF